MKEIIIIGGGIGGCGAALELANAGYKVTILEMRDKLLAGSSDDTPCRLGLGFHYIDLETAKMYLSATINVLKQYPEFVVAADKDSNHPYRRGRYFVATDSQFSLAEISALHEALKKEYTRLVELDPTNKVVGDPKKFSTPIPVRSYQNLVNTDRVAAGFETAEQTLDWPRFKQHLIDLVTNHPNIKVINNAEVKSFHRENNGSFSINVKINDLAREHKPEIKTFETHYLLNASWQNIEKLNATAGIESDETRTNRTKVMAQVELPRELEDKEINSMFFCFGPHCSITNIGNGKAFLSYEPVTNIESTTKLEVSEFSKRLLEGGATQEEKNYYGSEIIKGVSKYVPAIKDSKCIDVRIGNVRTKGEVDINSPKSAVHKRNELGVKTQQLGLVNFPCMKLLYFKEGASKIKEIFDTHVKADDILNNLVNDINDTETNLSTISLKEMREKIDANELLTEHRNHQMLSDILSAHTSNKAITNTIMEFADAGLFKIPAFRPYARFFAPKDTEQKVNPELTLKKPLTNMMETHRSKL